MKIETRNVTALALAFALCGGCGTQHHQLGGGNNGLDGGGAGGEAGRVGGGAGGSRPGGEAGGGAGGSRPGAAGSGGTTGDSGTGGVTVDSGSGGATGDGGTGGVAASSGTFGDPPDASDGGNDGSSCNCAKAPLFPVTEPPSFGGIVDLSCYCRVFQCPSYDLITGPNACVRYKKVSTFQASDAGRCDLITIETESPWGGPQAYTYDATTHELIGTYIHDTTGSIACNGEFVHAMSAGISPSPVCARGERIDPCE